MATIDDLTRIARGLPEVTGQGVDFGLGKKGLCWAYLARTTSKGRREVVPGVIAVRCDLDRKEMLIAAAPDRFFDDAHYRAYPAVLVRLDAIDADELKALLQAAWRLQAPKRLLREDQA